MVRKQVFDQLGYFDSKFGNFADVDMWLRISREFDVAYINEPLMTLMPKDSTRFTHCALASNILDLGNSCHKSSAVSAETARIC